MDKKTKERQVFEDALKVARARGGEARRNADRLAGEYVEREFEESPDLVIRVASNTKRGNRIIGIEHFRIDHYNELNLKKGHRDSSGAKIESEIHKLQHSFSPCVSDKMPESLLNDMAMLLTSCFGAREKSSVQGLVEQFEDISKNHLNKIESYTKRIDSLKRPGEESGMAFLIETHVDFSGVYLNSGKKVSLLKPGQILLFESLLPVIKLIAKKTSFIVFAFYPAFGGEILDAWILRTKVLNKSLERHGLVPVSYYGSDWDGVAPKASRQVSAGENDTDGIVFMVERNVEAGIMAPVMSALRALPFALKKRKENQPFVAGVSLQVLLDVCDGYLEPLDSKSVISIEDICQVIRLIPPETLQKRMDCFESRYFCR